MAEQTGVTTTDLQIGRDKLENDSQVAVSLELPGTYQKRIAVGVISDRPQFHGKGWGCCRICKWWNNMDYVQWMIPTAADDSVGYSRNRLMNRNVDCASFVFTRITNTGYNVSGYPFTAKYGRHISKYRISENTF